MERVDEVSTRKPKKAQRTVMFKDREIIELTEVIVFRSYDNKHQQPIKISPCEDETGKVFTGQGEDGYFDSLTEEDKRTIPYLVTPETVITVTDGKTLKPTNMADRENWRWIQIHPYLSLRKEDGHSSRKAVYYIENRRAEAEQRVSKAKNRDKARYLIQFELSQEKLVKVAKAIGHPAPQNFSLTELQDYLLRQCGDGVDPKLDMSAAILNAADPKNAESTGALITFHELLKWKIIERHRGGTYRFGGAEGTFVGHNETKVTEFLTNVKNQEIVAAMIAQLEDRKAVFQNSSAGRE